MGGVTGGRVTGGRGDPSLVAELYQLLKFLFSQNISNGIVRVGYQDTMYSHTLTHANTHTPHV